MSQTTEIDFKSTYFHHPELTRITGEPTYDTLFTMIRDIRENAHSVPSTLGRGKHGFLGLVMQEVGYKAISGDVAFDLPSFLTNLVEVTGATQFQILEARKIYDSAVNLCHECTLIQRVLIQQILEAIEDEYLSPFVDETTGLITSNIRDFLLDLVETYGDISPTRLDEKRQEVISMEYEDHTKPIDVIFTAI